MRTTIKLLADVALDLAGYGGQARDAFPTFSAEWPDGTGANEADQLYYVEATLAASATDAYDLTALTDAEGNALVLGELRVMAVYTPTGNPADGIAVAPGSSNPLAFLTGTTPELVVLPGTTTYPVCTGVDGSWTVDASNKTLQITNLSGTTAATYRLLLVGTSA